MNTDSSTPAPHRLLLLLAWGSMLLVSDLPNIFLNLREGEPGWLFWAKVGLLAGLLAASLLLKPLRPLWKYFFIFGVFKLVLRFTEWLGGSEGWQEAFGTWAYNCLAAWRWWWSWGWCG